MRDGTPGRSSKYNEERKTKILQALRAGNTRRTAASYAYINYSTLMEWAKKYPDFAAEMDKAEADAEIRNVSVIQRAAENTWQAAAWWLERKFKSDWSARVEQTGAGGGAQRIIVEFEKP